MFHESARSLNEWQNCVMNLKREGKTRVIKLSIFFELCKRKLDQEIFNLCRFFYPETLFAAFCQMSPFTIRVVVSCDNCNGEVAQFCKKRQMQKFKNGLQNFLQQSLGGLRLAHL